MQRSAASAQAVEQNVLEEDTYQETSSEAPRNINYGPVTKFKELAERGMVCDTIVRTITKDMGLETMTQVQSLTINETLKGVDV